MSTHTVLLTDAELEALAFDGNEYEEPANGWIRHGQLIPVRAALRKRLAEQFFDDGLELEPIPPKPYYAEDGRRVGGMAWVMVDGKRVPREIPAGVG
jgi:hypothetical protein